MYVLSKSSFAPKAYLSALLTASALLTGPGLQAQSAIEEIIVRAEFRPLPLMETPNSVSVITSDEISDRNATFLTEALATAPNLNYSSGASRGRFFQIRGIGERSQFVDPLNPGVGLIIDGIDYSTLGGAATLFDVQQVEVLRGPQGTLFGANALAGMINIRSNAPTEDFEGSIKAGLGNIAGNRGSVDSSELGLVLSGPLGESLKGRVAVQSNKSDGFVENVYLDRDDTQNIDEQSMRGRLHWEASDRLDIELTAIKLDIDNGYDSFTLDNLRETISDEPGTDALDSFALSTLARLLISEDLSVELTASTAQSDSIYSYDEDWTNPDICSGEPCDGWEYASFDEYLRDTRTNSIDARLLSSPSESGITWVAGIYRRSQEADLVRNYTYDAQFSSEYSAENVALYGQITLPSSERSAFNIGLRSEEFDADYSDNRAQTTATGESLYGGHLAFETQFSDEHFGYARLARGYKTGGVNVARGAVIPLEYETETLWNYELGLKSRLFSGVNSQIAFFYQDRRDAQVKQSFVECPAGGGACSFEDFVDNAAKAHSYGLEAEIYWPTSDSLTLNASIGLMQTAFDEYLSFSHINAEDIGGSVTPYDMSGEELAQSPEYQLTLSADFLLSQDLSLWIAYEAKDEFRFSNRHFAESESYGLVNARLVWNASEAIEIALWGRNLTNEDYTTRGFGSFPNDPRDLYTSFGPYVQFGEPREIGLSFEYDL